MINPDLLARVPGSHWVSAFNFDEDVRRDFDFPQPMAIIDSTLRKTKYTAGATTNIDGFLRIAAALADVGVRHESLNLDWWGDHEPNRGELELVREILAGGFSFTANVYADTLSSDGTYAPQGRGAVDLLVGLGAAVIAPGIVQAPDSEAEAVQFGQVEEVISYARSLGLGVTVTLAQCGRRDFAAMMRAANHAVALGATRLDLMDSTSSLSPEAMRVFVRRFRSALDVEVPLTMHVHDDFGLGTAGAIAAAAAGASPDVSVNGVSYRCGFPPLEEVVTSLEVFYGIDTGIDVGRLQWLSDLVAAETGIAHPALKPISGQYAFLKSTPGDVLASMRDGVDAFPPISGCVAAPVVGATVDWVWDNLSTPAMARQLAANLGLDVDPGALRDELDTAVARVVAYPRWLPREQAELIARRHAALQRWNALDEDAARALTEPSFHDEATRETVLVGRPYRTIADLLAAADRAAAKIDVGDLPAILDAHSSFESGPDGRDPWSMAEEAAINASGLPAQRALRAASVAYRERFGWTYVASADGRCAEDLVADVYIRCQHDPATELAVAREHLAAITRGRLARALDTLESA